MRYQLLDHKVTGDVYALDGKSGRLVGPINDEEIFDFDGSLWPSLRLAQFKYQDTRDWEAVPWNPATDPQNYNVLLEQDDEGVDGDAK